MVALSGGAYALKIPKNSVGTKQLKKNAVTSPKIKNGGVKLGEIKNGEVLTLKKAVPANRTLTGTYAIRNLDDTEAYDTISFGVRLISGVEAHWIPAGGPTEPECGDSGRPDGPPTTSASTKSLLRTSTSAACSIRRPSIASLRRRGTASAWWRRRRMCPLR